jgi:hypothetical protein
MVLQWMTSGDGPTVRASYPPASPSNHAQHASRASNDSKTTCKGQELFDLGRILNRPESDLATARSRQTVVVSQISSEENELKEESNYSGGDESADGKNEKIPAMILKTMSVTVESTREGSLVEEHIEAQTIDDKEDSG